MSFREGGFEMRGTLFQAGHGHGKENDEVPRALARCGICEKSRSCCCCKRARDIEVTETENVRLSIE